MSDADPEAKTISASLAIAESRATSPEESPQLLAGRYELLGMLGAGAMGTVYRARDRELDEIVALKVLKKELASGDMVERFRREVATSRTRRETPPSVTFAPRSASRRTRSTRSTGSVA